MCDELMDSRVSSYYSPSQSASADPAFEPHSTYMFDEPSVDQDSRNMRRAIESIHMMDGAGEDIPFSPMDTDHFQHDFNNQFFFDSTNLPPDSMSWQTEQALPDQYQNLPTTQEDILSGRGATVSHRYGQVTPPDDTTPKSFGQPPPPPTGAAEAAGSNAKSERARNAANQRHSKAKKARKDSVRKADTPEDDEDIEVDDRREKYREKNRVAAAKCRAKKKVNTDDLELSARQATARNNQLRAEERHLRDMFSSLRDQALAHDPTQGCSCGAIHAYNMHQAQRAVRGAAMGYPGGGMPSPPRGGEADSPSTIASSRTHSFSGPAPQLSRHPVRTQSMKDQMDFLASTAGEGGQSKYAFAPMSFDNQ